MANKQTQPINDYAVRARKMNDSILRASKKYSVVLRPVLMYPTTRRTLIQKIATFLIHRANGRMDFQFVDTKGHQ